MRFVESFTFFSRYDAERYTQTKLFRSFPIACHITQIGTNAWMLECFTRNTQ